MNESDYRVYKSIAEINLSPLKANAMNLDLEERRLLFLAELCADRFCNCEIENVGTLSSYNGLRLLVVK